MKYHLRTVIWKFKDITVHHPDLKMQKDIIISNPDDMFIHFSPLFQNQVRERFIVLWLSSANKVMSFEVVSEGSLNASIVHPREVFRGAIVATAASIILARNHPSDNPQPSQEDKMITRQLVESGKIIGIPVHDHLVFTNTGYYSFAEHGLL
jgi:DNA repair protein RadC